MAQLQRKRVEPIHILCIGAVLCALVVTVLLPRIFSAGFSVEGAGGSAMSEGSSAETVETASNASTDGLTTAQSIEKLVVHVDGAVVLSGVYELSEGSRVNDALEAAGGMTQEADTTSLNLAAKLADGQKIYVPKVGESSGEGSASANASGFDISSAQAGTNGLININTATISELDTLPGVGEATAATIIQDREQNGPFASIEDLMRISGIGEKKFAKVKDYICV